MRRTDNFLGLPNWGLNAFLSGLGLFTLCMGIKALISRDVALRVAETQFRVGNSSAKLEAQAQKLKEQAELLKRKDAAYAELKAVYEQSLKGQKGYGRLQQAIEAVENTPPVEDIEQIKKEITQTELDLSEVNSK